MKKILAVLLLMALLPTAALSNDDNHGLKIGPEECPAVWEDLVKFHLWSEPDALFDLGFSPVTREEVSTLKFVSFEDLDPGSWNIRRRVVFTMKVKADRSPPLEEATLTVLTEGNLFCEDEELKGFESFVLTWDL